MYNPVAASGVGAPMPPRLSERTRQLASRVAEAKGQRLTCSEFFCSKFLGALGTLPFCGLTGFTTVAANTTLWFVRTVVVVFPSLQPSRRSPRSRPVCALGPGSKRHSLTAPFVFARCARWARVEAAFL